MEKCILILILILSIFNNELSALEKISRQRRCIVFQKQSSGRADSGEGSDDEDYSFKRPQSKDPRPDRLQNAKIESGWQKKGDIETISPELLDYKKPPFMDFFRSYRTKNKFRNNVH